MQSTLAEVELSAVNGTHVFGAEHARALEELRTAQLALAQAWARSEQDEVIESTEHQIQRESLDSAGAETVSSGGGKVFQRDTAVGSGSGSEGKEGITSRRSLEEETEKDIMLARKRREANDRYFSRVNSGVLDVVGRLEEVAERMRRVEKESRSIWSEESDGTGVTTEDSVAGGGRRLRSNTLESKVSQKSAEAGSGS
jgi:hypothetical protein